MKQKTVFNYLKEEYSELERKYVEQGKKVKYLLNSESRLAKQFKSEYENKLGA